MLSNYTFAYKLISFKNSKLLCEICINQASTNIKMSQLYSPHILLYQVTSLNRETWMYRSLWD